MGSELQIKFLRSGGLITNYRCTSQCGHCLYYCSPRREKQYINPDAAHRNFLKIKELGCNSVHIGGGEPFLDINGLKMVLDVARQTGISIEYVETNSSWFRDRDSACLVLNELKQRGLSTLLVSISPFHNEYIPFARVKGVIGACLATGVSALPWIKGFYREVDAFETGVPHDLSEYGRRYGNDYLSKLPGRYWIHFGGRALRTFAPVLGHKDLERILDSGRRGCSELKDVSHFHLDLFGNYIPGLCSGLAIEREDLGMSLGSDKYPILCTLAKSGPAGLLRFAQTHHDFKPSDRYVSKCHLCLDIRRYLVVDRKLVSCELQPGGFYEEV